MFTVEVRPGEGGGDASRFAGELADAIAAGARRAAVDVDVTSASERGVTLAVAADPG